MKRILDAHPLFIYLKKESAYEQICEVLTEALNKKNNLLMSRINWGEIYYTTYRHYGERQTNKVVSLIETFPIDIIPVDDSLVIEAAKLKAQHSLSYADCFAAALAKRHHAELITGDPEFKSLEKEIKIKWIK